MASARLSRYAVILIGPAIAFGLLHATALAGVEIIVNSSDDDGIDANPGNGVCETIPGNNKCTLRAAIMEANASPGADTIRLQGGAPYVLLRPNAIGPDEDLVGSGGDLDIVNDDLTIEGNGATIDGNDTERVFHIAGNVNVVLNNLTVRNGGDGSGGGILNLGQLTINDSTITQNTASSHGGGIYSAAGSQLTLNRSTVSHNTATAETSLGGGIYNFGTLVANSSTVVWNETVTDWQSNGGAVANHGGSATFDGCVISHNECSNVGGAIWNTAFLTIRDSTLEHNLQRRSGVGGAIVSDAFVPANVDVLIDNSLIARNSPGAIKQNGATMTIRQSEIANNLGSTSAIHITAQAVAVIDSSVVRGHDSWQGAGILNYGNLTIGNRSVIRDNVCTIASGGAGIQNLGGSAVLHVENSLILHNTHRNGSSTGGGINNTSGADVTLVNSEIAENTAGWLGGGLHNDWRSTATIQGCLFRNNSGPSRGGGINSDNTVLIEDSAFVGNSAGRPNQGNTGGGAIFCSNEGGIDLSNVTISGNTTSSDGGGLHNQGDSTVTATTFSGNSASRSGDAIFQNNIVGSVDISNSVIATDGAGACANAGSINSLGFNI